MPMPPSLDPPSPSFARPGTSPDGWWFRPHLDSIWGFFPKMWGNRAYKSRAWLPGTGLPLSEGAGLGRGEGRREDERELGFTSSTTCWSIFSLHFQMKGHRLNSWFLHSPAASALQVVVHTLSCNDKNWKLKRSSLWDRAACGTLPGDYPDNPIYCSYYPDNPVYRSFQASPRLP